MLTNEEQDQLLDMNLETFTGLIEDTMVLNSMNQTLKDISPSHLSEFISDLYDDGYSVSDAVDDISYEFIDRWAWSR